AGWHGCARGRDASAEGGARGRPGGVMLVHAAFSSIGVTLALLRLAFFGRLFRYEGRSRSLAEYVRADLTSRERAGNALGQLAELPWFVRNLVVKVALATGFTPLARLVGYRSDEWPY